MTINSNSAIIINLDFFPTTKLNSPVYISIMSTFFKYSFNQEILDSFTKPYPCCTY